MVPTLAAGATLVVDAFLVAPRPFRQGAGAAPDAVVRRPDVVTGHVLHAAHTGLGAVVVTAVVQAQTRPTLAVAPRPATLRVGAKVGEDRRPPDTPAGASREKAIRQAGVDRVPVRAVVDARRSPTVAVLVTVHAPSNTRGLTVLRHL